MNRLPLPCRVGALAWFLGVLSFRPDPFDVAWGRALFLLAPLVIVPLGLALLAPDLVTPSAQRLLAHARRAQLAAALFLAASFLLEPGPGALLLALPWLATTAIVGLAGLLELPTALGSLARTTRIAAALFLPVGGAWAACERLGFSPLDFDPVIVLLTAIHFHYAGFALPLATGLAFERASGPIARPAALGVLAGVPLVAIGITTTQLGLTPWIETFAVAMLAVGGLAAAWVHLRLAFEPGPPAVARGLWGFAGLALLASMALAAAYGLRFHLEIERLSIPWMRVLHGTTNALGFALAVLTGWWFTDRRPAGWPDSSQAPESGSSRTSRRPGARR